MHELLQNSGPVAVTGQVAQVRGLGGIGKTLLAIEYVRRFETAWPGGIFWIDVRARWRSDDVDTLPEVRRSTFFASLASLVGVTPTPADPTRTSREVKRALIKMTAGRPYLWILDDVPDGTKTVAVEAMLPPDSAGATLMTTRWRALDSFGESLDLGVLDPLGPEHPKSLTTLQNLAGALNAQGDYLVDRADDIVDQRPRGGGSRTAIPRPSVVGLRARSSASFRVLRVHTAGAGAAADDDLGLDLSVCICHGTRSERSPGPAS